jgi:uncharacterized protein (DUF488 family)
VGQTGILTIGHSNRTFEAFLECLRAHGVTRLIDIRTVPRSRHNPQFNRETLAGTLPAAGVSYAHLPGLGGLRHAERDSVNTGWTNPSFRGYADYMQTEAFETNLEALLRQTGQDRVAIMCAEAVPWRCHRSLVSDALEARGVAVEHILSATRRQPHQLTSFARVAGTRVTYPGPPENRELDL